MQKTGQNPPPEVQDMVDRMLRRQQINKEQRAQENEQFTKVLMVAEKPSVAKMIAVSSLLNVFIHRQFIRKLFCLYQLSM